MNKHSRGNRVTAITRMQREDFDNTFSTQNGERQSAVRDSLQRESPRCLVLRQLPQAVQLGAVLGCKVIIALPACA